MFFFLFFLSLKECLISGLNGKSGGMNTAVMRQLFNLLRLHLRGVCDAARQSARVIMCHVLMFFHYADYASHTVDMGTSA